MQSSLAYVRRPVAATLPRVLDLGIGFGYLIGSLVLLGVLALYLLIMHGTPVVDDAYIAFVYARNLASGRGLTYVGGLPVEGYTDFLWVVVTAGGIKLGIAPQVTGQALSGFSGVLLVVCVWYCSQHDTDAHPGVRIAAPLLASLGPVAFWATGGLETMTFTLLAFAAAAALTGGRSRGRAIIAGVLFFLAALAHPDAVVFFVPALAFVALTERPLRLGRVLALALSFGVPFSLYWGWRWNHFGDFFPNTFYAKSDPSLTTIAYGVRYVGGLFPLVGSLSLALIAGALPLGLLKRPRNSLFLLLIASWLGYVVWEGGDGLLMHRFLLPIVPMLVILVQEALGLTLGALASRTGAASAAPTLIALAFVLCIFSSTVVDRAVSGVHGDGALDASRIRMGKWLAVNTAPTDSIAVNAAGAIPYYAQRSTIDMLGLNDRHIAHDGLSDVRVPAGHQRYDANYVLSREPVFIIFNAVREQGQTLGPPFRTLPSIDALVGESDFREAYTRVRLTGMADQEIVFVRNDRLSGFELAGLVSRVQVP